jgi:hypothetical protein
VTEELPPTRLPLVDNISETFDKLPPINLFRAAANAKTLYPAFIQYMYLLFKSFGAGRSHRAADRFICRQALRLCLHLAAECGRGEEPRHHSG